MKVTEEGCDDSNTVDGDGCSSSCVVETNWTCYNGSTTTSSHCLIANTFTMTVKYVKRINSWNTMEVAYDISPKYDQFTTMNFKKNITHNVPSSAYNVTYDNGLLILQFNYTETIESNSY